MEIKSYVDKAKPGQILEQGQLTPKPGEEKRVTAPVTKSKGTRKRNKFISSVLSDEAGNIGNYIFIDVLIPAVKKAISDVVTNGIDMLLYGETGHTKSSYGGSKISYRSYYDRESNRRPSYDRYRSASYDYDDIVFETRGDAELVLDNMHEIIDRYRVVTVADFYDLAGTPNAKYTDNKFGWTDLGMAQIVRIRDGYVIKLPRALAID